MNARITAGYTVTNGSAAAYDTAATHAIPDTHAVPVVTAAAPVTDSTAANVIFADNTAAPVTPSAPEHAAQGDGPTLGAVVYFSSASENTARFVANCRLDDEGINVYRIPLRASEPRLNVREPYVIMVPTYGGGNPKKAVPPQVKAFLSDPANREWIRGVIASGNTNFGEAFCMAGDAISRKCGVPFLYYFELMGTPEDVAKVRKGVVEFFHNLQQSQTNSQGK